jgi:hypothetical protein
MPSAVTVPVTLPPPPEYPRINPSNSPQRRSGLVSKRLPLILNFAVSLFWIVFVTAACCMPTKSTARVPNAEFHCPLRAGDRTLLASSVGFSVDSFDRLRDVLVNPSHSVALEFVLSNFFKWK